VEDPPTASVHHMHVELPWRNHPYFKAHAVVFHQKPIVLPIPPQIMGFAKGTDRTHMELLLVIVVPDLVNLNKFFGTWEANDTNFAAQCITGRDQIVLPVRRERKRL